MSSRDFEGRLGIFGTQVFAYLFIVVEISFRIKKLIIPTLFWDYLRSGGDMFMICSLKKTSTFHQTLKMILSQPYIIKYKPGIEFIVLS